jgi:hypothetical protein
MVQAYCVKCRAKIDIKDPKEVKLKDGRPAVKGTCPICTTNVFRIGAMPTEEAPAEKEESVMTIRVYCEACRGHRDMKYPKEVKLKDGRPAVVGSCYVCGTNMFLMGPMPKEATPPKDEIPTKDVHLNILKIRLAKGEITIEEFNKIKEILEDDVRTDDDQKEFNWDAAQPDGIVMSPLFDSWIRRAGLLSRWNNLLPKNVIIDIVNQYRNDVEPENYTEYSYELKENVVKSEDISQNNISKKGGALPKGFETNSEELDES